MDATVEPVLRSRASTDCTRCIVCKRRIGSDEDKDYVYREDTLIGAIHSACYDNWNGTASG